MKKLILITATLMICGCNPARQDEKKENSKVSIDDAFAIIKSIDSSLEFEERIGKTQIYGGPNGFEEKESPFYLAKKEWGDIELTIYLRTYDSPTVFDSGTLKLVFPKGYLSENRELIIKLTEQYLFSFVEEFVDDEQLKNELLADAYDYKPDNYVSSAHTKRLRGYLVDFYFMRDSIYSKTHDAITFSIERG
jgi:hypothetical protein